MYKSTLHRVLSVVIRLGFPWDNYVDVFDAFEDSLLAVVPSVHNVFCLGDFNVDF